MKKSFGEKIIDLIFYLSINLPYFLFLWLVFENVIKLNSGSSIVLATMFYLNYVINEIKKDQLEVRIKRLEDKI